MVIKPVFEDNDENKFSCIVNQTLENGTSSTLRRDFLLMVEGECLPTLDSLLSVYMSSCKPNVRLCGFTSTEIMRLDYVTRHDVIYWI